MTVTNKRELPSIAYWNSSVKRMDQKFYTTFSILGVAITNYLTGKKLNRNLYWVNIAYYYSLVFSLRTILFIAVGDYPTHHVHLANAVGTQNQYYYNEEGKKKWNYKYNWLRKFLETRICSDFGITKKQIISKGDLTDNLVQHSNSFNRVECVEILKRIGQVLNSTRPTRNDENYESLVSFHHVYHEFITPRVIKLERELGNITHFFLSIAITFFADFLFHNDRKEHYLSLINYKKEMEGLPYLNYSLHELGLYELYHEDINPIFDQKNLINERIDESKAKEVLKHISRDYYSSKSDLQNNFSKKVYLMDTTFKETLESEVIKNLKF